MQERRTSPIRETDAEGIRLGKMLLRSARYGALAVLDPETGSPSVSRVAVATAMAGTPIILISSLAAHTGALDADPRCSLLLGEPGKGDPLAHPRVTLACRARKLDRNSLEAQFASRRYLRRHPKAALYAGFGDFSWVMLEIDAASLNGGFGKAYRLTQSDITSDSKAAELLAPHEAAMIADLNTNHPDVIGVAATRIAKAKGDGWTVIGIDPDGLDLGSGDQVARLFFDDPASGEEATRDAIGTLLASRAFHG